MCTERVGHVCAFGRYTRPVVGEVTRLHGHVRDCCYMVVGPCGEIFCSAFHFPDWRMSYCVHDLGSRFRYGFGAWEASDQILKRRTSHKALFRTMAWKHVEWEAMLQEHLAIAADSELPQNDCKFAADAKDDLYNVCHYLAHCPKRKACRPGDVPPEPLLQMLWSNWRLGCEQASMGK